MIPAALHDALLDRALQRRDLLVYGQALRELSFHEHRRFKVAHIAKVLHLHPADVSRARKLLLELGYLERGPDDGTSRTYILRWVRGPLASAPLSQVA